MREKKGIFEGRSRRNSYPKGAQALHPYLMLTHPYRLSVGLYAPIQRFDKLSPISI